MKLKLTIDLFKNTRNEINKLNNEYENMSSINKIRSHEIRNSIEQKVIEINQNKQQREKHFNFIRKK